MDEAEGLFCDEVGRTSHRRIRWQLQRARLKARRGDADESLWTKLGEAGHHNYPDVSALPRRIQPVRFQTGRCSADHCSLEAGVLSRLFLKRGSRETRRRL